MSYLILRPTSAEQLTTLNTESKACKEKVPGFYAMIASISTHPSNGQLGYIYRYNGRHFEKGFFRTTRFARQFMRAANQLGSGYVATIMPNFYEKDGDGRVCLRQWVCYNGENFIEMKTFRGIHLDRIYSLNRAVDKLDLPEVPTFVGEST
jgi:hypothetical protein